MRRKPGHASVEEHPKGSGLYRVRARIGGRMATVASRLTRAVANATADQYGVMREEGELREGISLAQFGAGFLERRELSGVRAVKKDRNRWKTYIDGDPIGVIAIASLRRGDVVEWRDRLQAKKLAAQTMRNALNLLRVALHEALDRELVTENVAKDVRVGRATEATSREDLEGVLTLDEQSRLLDAVPDAMFPMVKFALFTGLRWSELSWLRREDVQMIGEIPDSVLVRRSTGGGPTKSGKPRMVPLLPPARGALLDQLAQVKASCPWVFPSDEGKPRQDRPKAWKKWVTAAGIDRPIRWHDLRHTCATGLLAGWWGSERWTLDEVCRMLGHAHISTTERYAHKLDETLRDAAKKKFPGGNGSGGSGGNDKEAGAFVNRRSPIRSRGVAPQEKGSIRDRSGSSLGTVGELPRSLKRAVKRASAKSTEGVQARRLAKAYRSALAGDEAATVAELRALARAEARP